MKAQENTSKQRVFKSFSELTITIPKPEPVKQPAQKKITTTAEGPKYKRTVFGKGVACYILIRDGKEIARQRGTGPNTLDKIAREVPEGDRVLHSTAERPLWDRVWKRKVQRQRIQKRLNWATGQTEMITKLA